MKAKIIKEILPKFINEFNKCPQCDQSYLMKDNKVHARIICTDDRIKRECCDCGTIVEYTVQM